MTKSLIFLFGLHCLLGLCFSAPAVAQHEDVYVPPILKPWVEWVLEKHPTLRCAVSDKARECVWPGRIDLALKRDGGEFTIYVRVDDKANVQLPGGDKTWPLAVTVDGSQVELRKIGNSPAAELTPGSHTIRGSFGWQELPEYILVSKDIALINLSVNGEKVARPKITARGELWLRERGVEGGSGEDVQRDALDIEVSRRLNDGIPFYVTTQLDIRVAGRVREIDFGKLHLENSLPVKISSSLTYRIGTDNSVTLQARPGNHTVTIEAVYQEPPSKLSAIKKQFEGWPSEEIWVWQGNNAFRTAQPEGGVPIDPSRTSIPESWKNLPAYALTPEQQLSFVETRRGEAERPPNQINLSRQYWLDLAGGGFVIQDSLNGTMHQTWRLNQEAATELAHVSVNGEDQLITKDTESGLSGVEIRNQNINIVAESRFNAGPKFGGADLPAVSWAHDVNSLGVNLSLPPGWTLLRASGPDNSPGTWFSSWTLLDFFIVILASVATAKLLGITWGAVLFTALVVSHRQFEAPYYVWFNLLFCIALLRVIPEGTFRRAISWYFTLAMVALVLILIPFAIEQIRVGLYPQLGDTYNLGAHVGGAQRFRPAWGFTSLAQVLLSGPLVSLMFLGGVIGGIYFMVKRRWGMLGLTIIGVGGLWFASLVVSSLSSSFEVIPAFAPATRSGAAPAEFDQAMELAEAPPVMLDSIGEALEEKVDSYSLRSSGVTASPQQKMKMRRQALRQVDPKAVVQTGYGIPNWSWNTWRFSWNGPVSQNERLNLWLIGPCVNFVLALLRVGLFIVLAWVFIDRKRLAGAVRRVVPAVLCLFVLFPAIAQAEPFPSRSLLEDLEQRLLKEHCSSDCTVASSLELVVKDEGMDVQAEVYADGPGAWPIPGPINQFQPESIRINGSDTQAVRRDNSGLLWVRLPAGRHRVDVSGTFVARNVVTLQFGLNPGRVKFSAPAWTVDGVSQQGRVEGSIQFTRKSVLHNQQTRGAAEKGEAPEVLLPHWYKVTRSFLVGLPWRVLTTVERIGEVERPAVTSIPLFPGEQIVTERMKVEKDSVIVTFARGANVVSWESNLEEEPELKLQAPKQAPYSEVWRLECSPIWKCSYSGANPISSVEGDVRLVTWDPWPGDGVEIDIEKPLGVGGSPNTIDSAQLVFAPGKDLLETTVTLAIRSSRRDFRELKLGANVQVEEVKRNGRVELIRPENGVLRLPLDTGTQNFEIRWREPWEPGLFKRLPAVDLGGPAANININLKLGHRTWMLAVGGPDWGPAVLLWGELIIILLVALACSRLIKGPLRVRDWVLLTLGLITLPALELLIVAAWFVALSFRGTRQSTTRLGFNTLQLFLTFLTLVFLTVLYHGVHTGLVGQPEMSIQGNGSSRHFLRWYVDAVSSMTPSPWILSVHIYIWKGLMLAWSSWLVFKLIAWLKWGWSCFSNDGLWRQKKKEVLSTS